MCHEYIMEQIAEFKMVLQDLEALESAMTVKIAQYRTIILDLQSSFTNCVNLYDLITASQIT